MRTATIVLAVASLSACHSNSDRSPDAAKPAALSYDGADARGAAARIAHGKRLSVVLDCTGCHGDNLQGENVTADDPNYGAMNAPNLTLAMARYSDADLVRLFRQGVPKDGRELWFMPVESFQSLSDRDLSALILYLRALRPAGTQLPPIVKGKGFAADVAKGIGDSKAQIARYRAHPPVDLGPATARGRYIVETTCTACHNSQLQGQAGFSPNLDIAGAYSAAELTRLLTTGEGKAKKDLGLMSGVAKYHFAQLTPAERADVVAYIKARADRPQ